jgi:hypothetical protein
MAFASINTSVRICRHPGLVTIHHCSILGFPSLCLLPYLWRFSACQCCDLICRQILRCDCIGRACGISRHGFCRCHAMFGSLRWICFHPPDGLSYSAVWSSVLSRSGARLPHFTTGFLPVPCYVLFFPLDLFHPPDCISYSAAKLASLSHSVARLLLASTGFRLG